MQTKKENFINEMLDEHFDTLFYTSNDFNFDFNHLNKSDFIELRNLLNSFKNCSISLIDIDLLNKHCTRSEKIQYLALLSKIQTKINELNLLMAVCADSAHIVFNEILEYQKQIKIF